ncbi:hypothetical protein [Roseofilum casamattae]|uniref:ABC transporter permease n=1 Tax=Roseofilum casamattae BLCC-M143 TaxID=3022442 RepID=A0ABT7BWW0_9CYAN|nr:hypothetical protein [Roseofilum casamattae]MDJ1183671.1 hypothetical protein [Roseofilum casamattae BLCC-M143]
MNAALLNRIGEWNPQLLREVKGRLKPAPVFLAVGAAVLLQGILILIAAEYDYSPYTQDFHWPVIFYGLTWILPLTLVVCGVFLLTSDMAKETRQGTLNFIRLSPQKSQSILLGKLLGVPIAAYLFVALCLPLHFLAALQTYSALSILAVYSLWIAGCAFFYTLALLFGTIGKNNVSEQARAGGASGITLMIAPYLLQGINSGWEMYASGVPAYFTVHWFTLPLASAEFGYGLTLITGVVATYWIWCALNRSYQNPQGTRLSKVQSYCAIASLQFWCLGFAVPLEFRDHEEAFLLLFGMSLLNLVAVISTAFAITPERQLSLDWARYRHQQVGKNRALIHDLLWGEKSPSILAIGFNIATITLVWSAWAFFRVPNPEKMWAILSLIISANLMLIYATVIQLGMLNRSKKRMAIATGSVFGGLLLPLIVLGALGLTPHLSPVLWISLVFGGSWFVLQSTPQVLVLPFALSLLSQLSLFALLNTTLTRTLKKVGESKTKALFNEGTKS